MRPPRLLDLYSCGGAAAVGYHRAGFDVVGVDIDPQPRYPYEFHQADAIEFLLAHGHEFDAVHGSPPCQKYTPLNAYNQLDYPDLVAATRATLDFIGKPYVIENVPQAPLIAPTILCGPMFGLKVYRHRGFETSGFHLAAPPHIDHRWKCARNGYLPTPERPFMSIHGGKHSRAWQRTACEYMDVPHLIAVDDVRTGIREISEAIPPAYTHHIGAALMAALEVSRAA